MRPEDFFTSCTDTGQGFTLHATQPRLMTDISCTHPGLARAALGLALKSHSHVCGPVPMRRANNHETPEDTARPKPAAAKHLRVVKSSAGSTGGGPRFKRRAWDSASVASLVALHAKLGNQWSLIARSFRSRSDNDCKNIFHSAIRSRSRQCQDHVDTEAASSVLVHPLLRAYAPAVGPNCTDLRVRQEAYEAALRVVKAAEAAEDDSEADRDDVPAASQLVRAAPMAADAADEAVQAVTRGQAESKQPQQPQQLQGGHGGQAHGNNSAMFWAVFDEVTEPAAAACAAAVAAAAGRRSSSGSGAAMPMEVGPASAAGPGAAPAASIGATASTARRLPLHEQHQEIREPLPLPPPLALQHSAQEEHSMRDFRTQQQQQQQQHEQQRRPRQQLPGRRQEQAASVEPLAGSFGTITTNGGGSIPRNSSTVWPDDGSATVEGSYEPDPAGDIRSGGACGARGVHSSSGGTGVVYSSQGQQQTQQHYHHHPPPLPPQQRPGYPPLSSMFSNELFSDAVGVGAAAAAAAATAAAAAAADAAASCEGGALRGPFGGGGISGARTSVQLQQQLATAAWASTAGLGLPSSFGVVTATAGPAIDMSSGRPLRLVGSSSGTDSLQQLLLEGTESGVQSRSSSWPAADTSAAASNANLSGMVADYAGYAANCSHGRSEMLPLPPAMPDSPWNAAAAAAACDDDVSRHTAHLPYCNARSFAAAEDPATWLAANHCMSAPHLQVPRSEPLLPPAAASSSFATAAAISWGPASYAPTAPARAVAVAASGARRSNGPGANGGVQKPAGVGAGGTYLMVGLSEGSVPRVLSKVARPSQQRLPERQKQQQKKIGKMQQSIADGRPGYSWLAPPLLPPPAQLQPPQPLDYPASAAAAAAPGGNSSDNWWDLRGVQWGQQQQQ